MTKIFEIFYTTTCDEYNQEHSSSRTVEAETEEKASEIALYDLDKHYPQGENSIYKIKDITWIYKRKQLRDKTSLFWRVNHRVISSYKTSFKKA